MKIGTTREDERLAEDARRESNWKRWGTYLSERQWGTVREDYSAGGEAWTYLPHDHARSRAYRFGEDGLLGWSDRQGRLCFAPALWNERDPILKERLFGLTGPEGNHGEDVKELYYYLDATPTHSYARALYQYPQREFPYRWLVEENARRGLHDPEAELLDSGVFAGGEYFDVFVEYAKLSPGDIAIRVEVVNRGPRLAPIHVLPTVWFRNTWAWGRVGESYSARPLIARVGPSAVLAEHESLGPVRCDFQGAAPELLFTDNETNVARLFGAPNPSPWVKDAFHARVVDGRADAVNPAGRGTKVAAWYRFDVPAGARVSVALRLSAGVEGADVGEVERILAERRADADEFYAARGVGRDDAGLVRRQAAASLLWSKQFYHYVVDHWLDGDPAQPPPPKERATRRNAGWRHLYSRDVISMPDKWEYPWFAAWDLAFHMIPFARLDPEFAKQQLVLFLREWYMHPNGQIPAYEFHFDDVNPPVHAWAAWRVYKMSARRGHRDRTFLARVFKKLLLNFTWWVNRKDRDGSHLFAGGFLGLDNIGVFDRSQGLPGGGHLEQADGTAWMAFYASTMLAMSLELARFEPSYEDMASKFFEHFVAIVDAMNSLGGTGLWDETDGFYYDQLHVDGRTMPLRTRSMVGIVPLFAVEILGDDTLAALPGFRRRTQWFLDNRKDLARHIAYLDADRRGGGMRLLAVPSRERLERTLRYVLDESEFLSEFGVRSLSRVHERHPTVLHLDGREYRVGYDPGESTSGMFGGNSNWRGPIWLPLNFLLIESLERYHHFYGDDFRVEFPTGSGRRLDLRQVAKALSERLVRLFVTGAGGRPCHGGERFFARPDNRDLVLFHEYFHPETGKGLGASHQTGWTALVGELFE